MTDSSLSGELTLEQAESPAFWLALCPQMSITQDERPIALEPSPLEEAVWEHKWAKFTEEGYLRLESCFPKEEAAQLAQVVLRVEEAVGVPVFAMVYDAFWTLIPRLAGTLARALGDSFRILPDCWIWALHPKGEDKGWGVHRDRDRRTLDPDGSPRALSLWIALTDATPDNGCIYALPAAYDPEYHLKKSSYAFSLNTLQSVRALPLSAGSALWWTQHLVHWGGRCSKYAKNPRVSVGFELQRSDVPAYSNPLLLPETMPSFSMRLGLIARQLLQYQHMILLPNHTKDLAQTLQQHLPKERSFAGVLKKLLRPDRKRTP